MENILFIDQACKLIKLSNGALMALYEEDDVLNIVDINRLYPDRYMAIEKDEYTAEGNLIKAIVRFTSPENSDNIKLACKEFNLNFYSNKKGVKWKEVLLN